jgi:hypothetical protein
MKKKKETHTYTHTIRTWWVFECPRVVTLSTLFSRDCMNTPLKQSGSEQTLAALHCVMSPLAVDTRPQRIVYDLYIYTEDIFTSCLLCMRCLFLILNFIAFYKFPAGDKSQHDCWLSRRIGFSLRKWRTHDVAVWPGTRNWASSHCDVYSAKHLIMFFSLVGHGAIAIFLLLRCLFVLFSLNRWSTDVETSKPKHIVTFYF